MQPEGASPALRDALTSACTSAARPASCAVEPRDSKAAPDATVVWEGSTRVVVRVRAGPGASEAVRAMDFRPSDAEADRWRAAGLVVASLSERGSDAESAGRPRAPSRAAPVIVVPATGVLLGEGLRGSAVREGGWLRTTFVLRDVPLFVGAGAAYSTAPSASAVTPTWLELALGFGVTWNLDAARLAVRPHLDAVILSESASLDGAGPSGSRWLDGLRVALGASWPNRSPVSLAVEASETFLSGGTGILLDNGKAQSFPAHDWSVLVGAEVPIGN